MKNLIEMLNGQRVLFSYQSDQVVKVTGYKKKVAYIKIQEQGFECWTVKRIRENEKLDQEQNTTVNEVKSFILAHVA